MSKRGEKDCIRGKHEPVAMYEERFAPGGDAVKEAYRQVICGRCGAILTPWEPEPAILPDLPAVPGV